MLFLSCTILCSTAFCRLSNDSQRRITQRIDIDGAAYRLHGQKLAGRAFSHEWNDVGETASAAAAGNQFQNSPKNVIKYCLKIYFPILFISNWTLDPLPKSFFIFIFYMAPYSPRCVPLCRCQIYWWKCCMIIKELAHLVNTKGLLFM